MTNIPARMLHGISAAGQNDGGTIDVPPGVTKQ
jgi:hypothetical protein